MKKKVAASDWELQAQHHLSNFYRRRPLPEEDLTSFEGVPTGVMATLVGAGIADGEDAQNSSPSIDEFLEFAMDMEKRGAKVTFHGYHVHHPVRDDHRVSVEGVDVVCPDKDVLMDAMEWLRMADELDRVDNHIHAWWD